MYLEVPVMRSLIQALGLSILLLWPMGPAFGKPVPEPETSR